MGVNLYKVRVLSAVDMKKSMDETVETGKVKLILEKGRKGLADGTIREWHGKKFKKEAGKWKPVGEGRGRGRPRKDGTPSENKNKNNTVMSEDAVKEALQGVKRGDEISITINPPSGERTMTGKFGSYDAGRNEVRFEQGDKGLQVALGKYITKINKNKSDDAGESGAGEALKPDVGSRMYDRGMGYDATSDYIPDFKNRQEKVDWEAGLKAKYDKEKAKKAGAEKSAEKSTESIQLENMIRSEIKKIEHDGGRVDKIEHDGKSYYLELEPTYGWKGRGNDVTVRDADWKPVHTFKNPSDKTKKGLLHKFKQYQESKTLAEKKVEDYDVKPSGDGFYTVTDNETGKTAKLYGERGAEIYVQSLKDMKAAGFSDMQEYVKYKNDEAQTKRDAERVKREAEEKKIADEKASTHSDKPVYVDMDVVEKLAPMVRGRVKAALDKQYRYNGKVVTLRDIIESGKYDGIEIIKTPKVQFNRAKFNRMDGKQQKEYEKQLNETKDSYALVNESGGMLDVPKIVYEVLKTNKK